MKNLKVHIVGGKGQMGKFLANLFDNNNIKITISGSDNKNLPAVASADIVLISVPNILAPQVIDNVSKPAKKNTLIVDLSSVKTKTIEALKKINQPILIGFIILEDILIIHISPLNKNSKEGKVYYNL